MVVLVSVTETILKVIICPGWKATELPRTEWCWQVFHPRPRLLPEHQETTTILSVSSLSGGLKISVWPCPSFLRVPLPVFGSMSIPAYNWWVWWPVLKVYLPGNRWCFCFGASFSLSLSPGIYSSAGWSTCSRVIHAVNMVIWLITTSSVAIVATGFRVSRGLFPWIGFTCSTATFQSKSPATYFFASEVSVELASVLMTFAVLPTKIKLFSSNWNANFFGATANHAYKLNNER